MQAPPTAATLAARLIGVVLCRPSVGRSLSGLRSGVSARAQSRSFLIAGSTFAVFLVAALWGAAWIVGLVSGPASLIRLGRP